MKALDKLDGGKNSAAVGCHGVKKLMINFILKNEAKVRERVTASDSCYWITCHYGPLLEMMDIALTGMIRR